MTYAKVTSTLAVLVVLASGADAALKVPPNSVGARQLRARSVVAAKIAPEAVNSAKIRDGSLLSIDVGDDPLLVGPKGPVGDPGPKALLALFYYSNDTTLESGFVATGGIGCSPAVPTLVGGGVRVTGAGPSAGQTASGPDGRVWKASADNRSGQTQTVTFFSICTVTR